MNTCLVISKDRDETYMKVTKHLGVLGIKVVTDVPKADFTIVLGGDGSVLGAARKGVRSPVVVINTGHLGFLTSSSKDEAVDIIERVLMGEFTVTTRHLLTAQIGFSTYYALNDLVIRPRASNERNLNKLISISVFAKEGDGPDLLVNTYRADGLIVATPTGSTAYSLSAMGPIIHPSCKSFVITPICPQGITQRPLVLPHGTLLRFIPEDDDLFLSVDSQVGQPIEKGMSIKVSYNAQTIQTVNPIHSYYEVLQKKLHWGVR